MIDRARFLEKLRQLGYIQAHRATENRRIFFMRDGSSHRLPVTRRGDIEEETVRFLLTQAGCSLEEVESFIADAQSELEV